MGRTFVVALFALALGFTFAGRVRAFAPWLQMTTPCEGAPSAVAIGNGKVVVVCAGDSHLHYRDFLKKRNLPENGYNRIAARRGGNQ